MFSFAGGGNRRLIRNQERKFATRTRIALDPYFTAHALHQSACDRQTQSHAVLTLVAGKTEKVVENFQMKLRRNSGASIGYTDLHRVGMADILPPPFRSRGQRRSSPLPHIGLGMQPDRSGLRRELERILEQIRNDALHLGGVKRKDWKLIVG